MLHWLSAGVLGSLSNCLDIEFGTRRVGTDGLSSNTADRPAQGTNRKGRNPYSS